MDHQPVRLNKVLRLVLGRDTVQFSRNAAPPMCAAREQYTYISRRPETFPGPPINVLHEADWHCPRLAECRSGVRIAMGGNAGGYVPGPSESTTRNPLS